MRPFVCRLRSCYPCEVLYSPLCGRGPRALQDRGSSQRVRLCGRSLEGQRRDRRIRRVLRKIVRDQTVHVSAAHWTVLVSLLDVRWW